MDVLIEVFYVCCVGFGVAALIAIFIKLFGDFTDWLFKE